MNRQRPYQTLQWGLVIAGISDFYRPVEDLSVNQNAALTATGLIWTRWCLIIKPKNYPSALFLSGHGGDGKREADES